MKHFGHSKAKGARESDERLSAAEAEARANEKPGDVGTDYGRLGEQVTAVLTTAEQAAAEIRETAGRDAENIRLEAEKHAANARAEADALRADADAYQEQTRKAADTYAGKTRRSADAETTKAQAALEEKARAMQAESSRKAKEIEAEALRRRDALRQSAAQLEERIAGLLTTFRAMTTDLEGLLRTAPQHEDGKPDAGDDVAVEDTLEDVLKPDRAPAPW